MSFSLTFNEQGVLFLVMVGFFYDQALSSQQSISPLLFQGDDYKVQEEIFYPHNYFLSHECVTKWFYDTLDFSHEMEGRWLECWFTQSFLSFFEKYIDSQISIHNINSEFIAHNLHFYYNRGFSIPIMNNTGSRLAVPFMEKLF